MTPPAGNATDLLHEIEDDSGVDAVTVSRDLPKEFRGIVLRLHANEPVVSAKTPAARVPLEAAADVARQKRLRLVDPEAGGLEKREPADAARQVRHDRSAIRRR